MDVLILLASLTLTGYTAWYTLMCAVYPFTHCRRCDGLGKRYSPFNPKVFRLCLRCAGTGRRVRTGRRVYDHLRGQHTAGPR